MKKIFLLFAALILIIPFASAAWTRGTNNLVSYLPMNEGSGTKLNDATNKSLGANITSGTAWITGKNGYGVNVTGSSDMIRMNGTAAYISAAAAGGFTLNFWIYLRAANDQYDTMFYVANAPDGSVAVIYDHSTNGYLNLLTSDTVNVNTYAADPPLNSWVMITAVVNSTNLTLYYNGSQVSNTQPASVQWLPNNFGYISLINQFDSPTRGMNGAIDEFMLWNASLEPSEVSALWNNGTGFFYPFTTTENVTDLLCKNIFSGNSLNNYYVNITVNGVNYDFNSSGDTNITLNSSFIDVPVNITFSADNYLINTTYTNVYLISAANFLGNISYGYGYVYVTDIFGDYIEEFTISGGVISNNSVSIATSIPRDYGNITLTFNKTGYFTKSQTFEILGQTTPLTITDVFTENLTINPYMTNGSRILSFNVTIESLNDSWNETGSSTNGSYETHLINGTYTITIDNSSYELSPQNYTSYPGNHSYNQTLQKTNSVQIYVYKEADGTLLNVTNVSILFTSNSTSWTNTTTSGSIFVYNIPENEYQLLFTATNYTARAYTITVGNRTTQNLNAYLANNSALNTTFTVTDSDTQIVLADVLITMYKIVNSSWTPIESKYTDVTGKIQFSYIPLTNYKFYLAKSGYTDYVFYLNPILFSTYEISMTPSTSINYSQDYDQLAIIYAPSSFMNQENTTFNFIISAPYGSLIEYGINLTYPGGSVADSGSNAIGSQLSVYVYPYATSVFDTVNLTYWYNTTLSGYREFSLLLPILDNLNASYNNTFMANNDETYGLGIFERILIATLIAIFVAGIATLVGQPIPGFALALFIMGYMVYIGFIPIWAVLPSMFIGILFLIWKSGGY